MACVYVQFIKVVFCKSLIDRWNWTVHDRCIHTLSLQVGCAWPKLLQRWFGTCRRRDILSFFRAALCFHSCDTLQHNVQSRVKETFRNQPSTADLVKVKYKLKQVKSNKRWGVPTHRIWFPLPNVDTPVIINSISKDFIRWICFILGAKIATVFEIINPGQSNLVSYTYFDILHTFLYNIQLDKIVCTWLVYLLKPCLFLL